MRLFNTYSRKVEDFIPFKEKFVSFYACGPTVYDYTHVGHMRTFINNDLLRRTLTYLGYSVKHVMNVTDVGHLTGDGDEGEDKMEKGAVKSGKSVWEVAQFYTDNFIDTMKAVHVLPVVNFVKATDHIADMIALIQKLENKGYVYKTKEALYFDSSKFADYGKLGGQKQEEKRQGAREDVKVDKEKKHAADFALWFFRVGRFRDHQMHWDSPWGDGFPGWHIECSAMSMKYLGETIDIHAGGIDHIPVHHENEIAQSEAATGKPFVKIWFHNAFLLIDGQKMSKSLGNFYTKEDFRKHGIDPIAVRYFFLQAHYRQQVNFTWEAVQAAQTALNKLREMIRAFKSQTQRTMLSEEKLGQVDELRQKFSDALSNDLQVPQALAVVWETVKSNIPSEDKLDLLLEFDRVLGLGLEEVEIVNDVIPDEIVALADRRGQARAAKDFTLSDKLRLEIEKKGYTVEDRGSGHVIKRK